MSTVCAGETGCTVDITGFASGSLIVNFDIILPADSTRTSDDVLTAISNGFGDGFGIDPAGTQLTGI